jgi:hypothetical protein
MTKAALALRHSISKATIIIGEHPSIGRLRPEIVLALYRCLSLTGFEARQAPPSASCSVWLENSVHTGPADPYCAHVLANPDAAYSPPEIAPFHGCRYGLHLRAAQQPMRVALLGRAALEAARASRTVYRGLHAD